MPSYRFGSSVPGALDAFNQAYLASSRLQIDERAAKLREALAGLQAGEIMERGDLTRALPGDIAALTGGGAAPPSVANPAAIRALPSGPPAPGPVMPPPIGPHGVPLLAGPYGSVAGDVQVAQFPEQPADAPVMGPPPGGAPMTVAPPMGAGGLLPPEAGPGDPSGVTMRQLAQQIGPDRLARLLRTDPGRLALTQRGMVTEEEFQRRQVRAQARNAAGVKFREAQEAYESGNPERTVQGLQLEAAAWTQLAQVADKPEGMLARVEKLREQYLKAHKDQAEKKKLARDLPRLMSAYTTWVEKPDDPGTTTKFFEALASMESDAGQKRADQLSAKLADGLIERVKRSPTAAFDQVVAQVIEQRRDAGTEIDLNGIYQQAAKANPGAFATYLNYVMTHAKEIPKPLLKIIGASDVPSDIVHEADALVTQVMKIPRGSGRYYEEFSKKVTELTRERPGPQDRASGAQERTADVQLRKQLQDDIERLERELGRQKESSPFANTTNLEQRLAQAKQDLDEHDARMRDRGYLGRGGEPGTRVVEPGRPGPAGAPSPPPKSTEIRAPKPGAERKKVDANAPPKGATLEDAVAETKRLMSEFGISQEAALDLMRRKGWRVK